DALLTYRVRGAEGVPGRDPDRRVEQDDTLDSLGEARRELDQDAAAEAVADPRCSVDARRGSRLEHVVDVRLEAPRRLPPGAAVPAQVGSEHTESREPSRQVREAGAVGGDAVEAHDGRRGGAAPFVQVQPQTRSSTRS